MQHFVAQCRHRNREYDQFVLVPGDDAATAVAAFVTRQKGRIVRADVKMCDYCGEVPAEGFVAAYNACVCEACYDDHHGSL